MRSTRVSLKEAVAEVAAVTGRAAARGLSARAGARADAAWSLSDGRLNDHARQPLGRPPRPQPERQVAFRTGLSAESRAAAFLIAKGFRIVARRWRSPARRDRHRRAAPQPAGVRRGQGARYARRCGLVGDAAPARAHRRGRRGLARAHSGRRASATSASMPCWSRPARIPRTSAGGVRREWLSWKLRRVASVAFDRRISYHLRSGATGYAAFSLSKN